MCGRWGEAAWAGAVAHCLRSESAPRGSLAAAWTTPPETVRAPAAHSTHCWAVRLGRVPVRDAPISVPVCVCVSVCAHGLTIEGAAVEIRGRAGRRRARGRRRRRRPRGAAARRALGNGSRGRRRWYRRLGSVRHARLVRAGGRAVRPPRPALQWRRRIRPFGRQRLAARQTCVSQGRTRTAHHARARACVLTPTAPGRTGGLDMATDV
jgi:hypothetical protein